MGKGEAHKLSYHLSAEKLALIISLVSVRIYFLIVTDCKPSQESAMDGISIARKESVERRFNCKWKETSDWSKGLCLREMR